MGTILIVDDDAATCELLARLLRQHGKSVCCVTSGREALAFVQSQPADLMLLDISMPGMDGITLLRLLRADPRYEHLAIIVYSAVVDPRTAADAAHLGAQVCVPKGSTSFDSLFEMIERFDNGRSARDSADDRRRAPRLRVEGVVTVHAAGRQLVGTMRDRSATGVSFELAEALCPGLFVTAELEEERWTCQVVHWHRLPDGRYAIGAVFRTPERPNPPL